MENRKSFYSPVGEINPSIPNVHIYGAGLSGLLLGYQLLKAGYHVDIFEKESRVGGKIQSQHTPWGLVEKAANSVLVNPSVMELITELDLKIISPASRLKRQIIRKAHEGPSSFPFLLDASEWVKLFFSLLSRPPQHPPLKEQSVEDFFKPLLGQKACDQILSPALSGIYALPASQLHFSSVFRTFSSPSSYGSFIKEMVQKISSVKSDTPRTVSFAGGMEDLVLALKEKLKDHIHLNSSPPLDPHVNNCLCTNAWDAAEVLQSSSQFAIASASTKLSLANLLRTIGYIPVRTSTYFLSQPIPFLHRSFGLLFSPQSHFRNLGILNNSEIFPHRPHRPTDHQKIYSYTFIAQGLSDHHLDIVHDMQRLGVDPDCCQEKVTTYYDKGIPKYDLNRYKVVEQLKDQCPKGLLIFGNYTQGLSIRDLITESNKIGIQFQLGVNENS